MQANLHKIEMAMNKAVRKSCDVTILDRRRTKDLYTEQKFLNLDATIKSADLKGFIRISNSGHPESLKFKLVGEEYEGRMTRSRTSARPVMNRHNSATSTLVLDGFVCRSVRTYLKLNTKYPEFKSLMNEIALATNKTLPREILRDFFVKYQFSNTFENLHS